MGQYHKAFNLDKKQMINPHRFGDGLKLYEFADGGKTMMAIGYLLACSPGRGGGDWVRGGPLAGSWAGDRIAIVGYYAEAADIPGIDASAIYQDKSFQDISDAVRLEFPDVATKTAY